MALRADDVDLDRDRGLVRRFQEGDGEAFGELYGRYYDRLERFCGRRVPDHHTAEEIAQEAFARALTALPDLGGDRRFYPWVSVIAAHLCVDWHRRQGRWEPDPDPDPGPVAGGQDAIVDAVDVTLALAALARLAPRHQDVLQLREIEGWSYRRISEHFGVSIGAVETLLFRARHALRREFRLIEGGGLAAVPVLGWALRLRHIRWLRVPKWVAVARHPTTAVAVTASATVAAVSLVLIPVTVPPPAGSTAPTASTPAAPADLPSGNQSWSPSAKGAAAPAATFSAAASTDALAAVGSTTQPVSTGVVAAVAAPVSAPTAPALVPTTIATPSAPSGSTTSGLGLGLGTTASGLGLDRGLPASPVAGVTNTLSSLSGSVPPVSLPPVTVPPAVGSTVGPTVGATVTELTTTAGHLLDVVPTKGRLGPAG